MDAQRLLLPARIHLLDSDSDAADIALPTETRNSETIAVVARFLNWARPKCHLICDKLKVICEKTDACSCYRAKTILGRKTPVRLTEAVDSRNMVFVCRETYGP